MWTPKSAIESSVDLETSSDPLGLQRRDRAAGNPHIAREEAAQTGPDHERITMPIESMVEQSLFSMRFGWRHGEKDGDKRKGRGHGCSVRCGFDVREFVEITRSWNCRERKNPSLVFAWKIQLPKPFRRLVAGSACFAPERHEEKVAI
jgi:hypothetical protein